MNGFQIVDTSEMRFSVGWFDEDYLNSCPILVARNAEGRIDAFANIIMGFPAAKSRRT